MAITDKTALEKNADHPLAASAAPVDAEPRNFFVAFLLTMVAGPLGLRHFYLGDAKFGWIRSGLFVGGYAWMIAMSLAGQAILGFLGFIAITIAGIWSVVDFFYVYNAVKTDASGQLLTSTSRDRKWARSFYLAAIIGFVALVILSIIAGIFVEQEIKNGAWRPSNGRNYDPYGNPGPNFEQYMQQLQNQTNDGMPSY